MAVGCIETLAKCFRLEARAAFSISASGLGEFMVGARARCSLSVFWAGGWRSIFQQALLDWGRGPTFKEVFLDWGMRIVAKFFWAKGGCTFSLSAFGLSMQVNFLTFNKYFWVGGLQVSTKYFGAGGQGHIFTDYFWAEGLWKFR